MASIVTYRNTGYSKGYVDGVAHNSSNATIQYTYHTHASSCSCSGAGVLSGYNHGNQSANWIALKCNKCGLQFDYATKSSDGSFVSDNWWTLYNMSDSKASTHKCYKTICGKSTDTVESAVIMFE